MNIKTLLLVFGLQHQKIIKFQLKCKPLEFRKTKFFIIFYILVKIT